MTMDAFLSKLGCSAIAQTKERFLDDSEFYLQATAEMLSDPGFERLGEQLRNGDVKDAFDTAHMLKGITANCGITPLYEMIVQLVEPLRRGSANMPALNQMYARLLEKRDTIRAALVQKDGSC